MSELYDAPTLVRHAQLAEDAGLEFVAISDHIHPWITGQDHSPFAWSVLGGVAASTSSIDLATGLTCPIIRYHPAVIAQAAATVATMAPGRTFTLAVGAGERLNEHVTGAPFPAIDVRHEMLAEACEIIRALWNGEWTTIRGEHLTVEDTKLFEIPDEPVRLVVGVSGPASLQLALDVEADGVMAVEPLGDLLDDWADRGGNADNCWTEVPIAYAESAEEGLALAHERLRFSAQGWKVMSELPNPVNFDAATAFVRPEDLADDVPHGPDPEPAAEAIRTFVDAGFDHVSIIPAGDAEATVRFFCDEVRPLLDV